MQLGQGKPKQRWGDHRGMENTSVQFTVTVNCHLSQAPFGRGL